jgi:hypothetical protein
VRALLLASLIILSAGCVERRLLIRSEPDGALVRVNGNEIGRTPTSWRFYHYGKVRVELEHDGFEPESRIVELKPPWYQYPVADFVSDVLVPSRIEDHHEVEMQLVALTPPEDLEEAEIQARLEALTAAAIDLRDKASAPESAP